MNAILIIARREVKALFDLPTAYILLVIFIGLNGFLYFPQIEVERLATLRPMLDLLPWLLMVFVPAVTMRALAEDVRAGTLEVVLAQPITERELLLGKYLGQVVFLWITLALTLAIPLGLWLGARLEVGVLIAQYVGAALLVAGFAAVGLWASSVTRNQITAFILGVAVMFALVIVAYDPILVGLPAQLGAIAAAFGVLAHFQQIARGAVDLRDVIYFLTLAAVFLSLAYFSLMRRKLSPGGAELKRLRLGTTLLVAVLVMLNLFGRWIGGRLDLSPGRQFTLSGASKDLLAHIPDLVTIKLFASSALPPEVAYVKRDVDDLLGDYRASGHGRVRLVVIDPSGDSTAAREAASLGIPPVQFNVMGQSSLQVKEGYLGLAVQYANEVRQIPLIRQTSDLEYRLTAFIRDLTRTSRPAVGWVGVPSNSQQDQGSGYNTLRSSLDHSYTVRDIALTSDSTLGTDLKVLVLSDAPDSIPPAQLEPLRRFLAGGGSALVMASGMRHSMQEPFAMARKVPWNALLQPFGISIQSDIVYDLAANEAVSMPSQYGQVVMAYPLWIRAGSTRASTVNAEVTGVFLPWTSSIDTTHAPKGTVTPLLVSSRAAGAMQGQAMLSPQQDFARTNLSTRILAVAVSPSIPAVANAPKGRLVVIGNDDFASDRFAQNQAANVVFVENAIDWLAQDDALIAIRSKDRTPPPLVFPNAAVKVAVRYGNLIGIPLGIVLFGATRLMRRRRLTRQAYRPLASGAAA
jgi:ABC-2 type transport system permease protein